MLSCILVHLAGEKPTRIIILRETHREGDNHGKAIFWSDGLVIEGSLVQA